MPECIYICHHCWQPNYFDREGKQFPGASVGKPVADVPEESVQKLYDEARSCAGSGSYTASVLACRKLLMHIAVAKGAAPGLRFVEYVEFLAAKSYVPPEAKEWVDHIRDKGNEANHEINIMTKDEAEELIEFSEILLKVIFQFPAVAKRRGSQALKTP